MKADGTRTVSIGRRTVVGLFLGAAALYWILEAVLHVIVFHEGTFVTQLFTADPHELWMRSTGSILIALLGVFVQRSMVGRRRAVEALRAREEDSRRLFRNAQVALFRSRADDGTILECNDLFAHLLGYEDREECLAECVPIQHYPDAATRDRAVEEIRTHDAVENAELQARRRDGSSVWISYSARFYPDEGILEGAVVDVTQRKQTEEMLREYRERLESLVKERTAELVRANDQLRGEIGARTGTERILREQRNLFHTILSETPDLVALKDRDSVYQMANSAFCRLVGKSEEEVVGMTDFDLFPQAEAEAYRRDDRRVMETGVGQIQDEETTWRVGKRWLQVAKTPFRDERGECVGILCSVRDVTDRKRAEKALEESEEWFRALTESTSDWIWQIDADGFYTYASPKVKDLLGYEPEEVMGKTPFDLMPPEEAARLRIEFGEIAEARRSFQKLANLNLHKDGHPVWLETSGEPILGERGELLGYRGIDRDITDRKRAEEELRRARDELEERVDERTAELTAAIGQLHAEIAERERTEQLLQTLNAAALAMERARTPEEIFSAVSGEFSRIGCSCIVFLTDEAERRLRLEYVSFEPEAIRGVDELIHVRVREFSVPVEDIEYYRRLVRDRASVFIENVTGLLRQCFPRTEGNLVDRMAQILRISRSIGAPLIVEDRVIGVFSVQSDDLTEDDTPLITAFAHQLASSWHKATLLRKLEQSLEELRSTQDQLLQAQKMEAIGTLAGGIAHDFNNLLSVIQGCCDLAMMRAGKSDPLNGELEQIRRTAERAARLTRQLLLFSRKQPMELRPVSLAGPIEEFCGMLRRSLGAGISVETELDPELWIVLADAAKMEQVLMNLAVNARDAMPEGGKLAIRAKNVVLHSDECTPGSSARPGRFVCLEVEDEGVGIDEEVKSHIFEPFFTTKSEGIGLGLPVVYGVVQQHGGWIEVGTDSGRGTVFAVYLPASSSEPARESPPDETLEGLEGHGERILFVEDEERLCEVAAKALRRSGYIVFTARTAEETLDIFEREEREFHLVLTDISLPDKTGLQLVDQLLERKPGLRVLLSSGYSERKVPWSAVEQRGFGFLQKPYGVVELVRAVKGAVCA